MKELKELSEKWYVVVTKENQNVLNKWRNENIKKPSDSLYSVHCKDLLKPNMSLYSFHKDESMYCYNDKVSNATEISFEDFKRLVLKEEYKYTIDYCKNQENKVAIHVSDYEEVEQCDKLLGTNHNYLNSFFPYYPEQCINPTCIEHCNITYYKNNFYEIIEAQDFIKNNTKEFILPPNWHVVVNKDNIDILSQWRFGKKLSNLLFFNCEHMCGMYHDCNGGYQIGHDLVKNIKVDNVCDFGQEITTEQFKQYVLKETIMKTQRITKTALKEIYNISCSDYKKIITDLAKNFPFDDYVEISNEEVTKWFNASSSSQKSLLNKYLKNQLDKSIDLSAHNVDGFKLFDKDTHTALLCVRNDYASDMSEKAFRLNDKYNWELKKDNKDALCLVPTRK